MARSWLNELGPAQAPTTAPAPMPRARPRATRTQGARSWLPELSAAPSPAPEPEEEKSWVERYAPTIARIGLPVIGGIAGSVVPGIGTAAGAALGGALGAGIGETAAEAIEGRELDPLEIGLSTALGAVPAGPAGRMAANLAKEAAKTGQRQLLKRAGLHAAEGAAQGLLAEGVHAGVKEGRLPTLEEAGRGVGFGAVLGGAIGAGADLAGVGVSKWRGQAPKVDAPPVDAPAVDVATPPPVWEGAVPPELGGLPEGLRGREEIIADIMRSRGLGDVYSPPPPTLRRPSFVNDLAPAPDPGPELGYGRGGVPASAAPPIEDLIQRSLTTPPAPPRLGQRPAPIRGLGEQFTLSQKATEAVPDAPPPIPPQPAKSPLVAEQPLREPGVSFTEQTPVPRDGDRRVATAPTATERRVAQRRTEFAQRFGLPEDHPAVQEAINLHAEARTDVLTGLLNKRGWKEISETATDADQVVFMDGKKFKAYNDQYGHAAGDHVLGQFAKVVREVLGDESARPGGDEFTALLRNMTPEAADAKIAELQTRAAGSRVPFKTHTGEIIDIPPLEVHIARGKNEDIADALVNAGAAKSREGGRGDVALPDPNRITPDPAVPGRIGGGLDAGRAELASPAPSPIRPAPPQLSPGQDVRVKISGREQNGILIQTGSEAAATGLQMRGRAKVRLPSGKTVFVKPGDIAPNPQKLNVTPNPPRMPRPTSAERVTQAAQEVYDRPLVQTNKEQVAAQMERAYATQGPIDTTAKPAEAPFNLDRMNLTRDNKEMLGRMYAAAPDKYEAAKGGTMSFEQMKEMGLKIGGIVSPQDFERALKQGAPLSDPGMVVYAKELSAERARQMGKARAELAEIIDKVGSAPTERADRIMLEDAQHRFLEASLQKANLDLTLSGAQAQAARTLVAFKIIGEERGPLEKLLTRMFNESC